LTRDWCRQVARLVWDVLVLYDEYEWEVMVAEGNELVSPCCDSCLPGIYRTEWDDRPGEVLQHYEVGWYYQPC